MLHPMNCFLLVLVSAAALAVPLDRRFVYGGLSYGGYGFSPAVRAVPAFDGPAFAPVRNDEETSVNDVDAADDSYSFEYNVQADDGGHSRQEARDSEGTVKGRYTITLSDGRFRTVDYIADKDGFRAKVDTNEPGTDNQAPADVEWSSSASRNPPPKPPQITQPGVISSRPEIVVPPSNVISEPRPQDGSITSRPGIPPEPARPIQVIQPVVPTKPEEPRSPHHPPIGFFPPEPFSRVHLAPPRPIDSRWGPTVAYHDPLFSSQWPASQAPLVLPPYLLRRK